MVKTHKITFRITESQKEKIEEKAKSLGMSVSEFIRHIVAKDSENK